MPCEVLLAQQSQCGAAVSLSNFRALPQLKGEILCPFSSPYQSDTVSLLPLLKQLVFNPNAHIHQKGNRLLEKSVNNIKVY